MASTLYLIGTLIDASTLAMGAAVHLMHTIIGAPHVLIKAARRGEGLPALALDYILTVALVGILFTFVGAVKLIAAESAVAPGIVASRHLLWLVLGVYGFGFLFSNLYSRRFLVRIRGAALCFLSRFWPLNL